MLSQLYELFTKTLPLAPDLWLYICLGIVAVPFLVTLIAGLVAGDFKKCKSLMGKAISSPAPNDVLAVMKQMPANVKQQYKRARMAGVRPSDFVSERECVTALYKRSLISKVWVVTFVATVIAAAVAFFVVPLSMIGVGAGTIELADAEQQAALQGAPYYIPLVVVLAGSLFTLIGAIVGKLALGGAVKTYATFAPVLDGDVKGSAPKKGGAQPQAQPAEEGPEVQVSSHGSFAQSASDDFGSEPVNNFEGEEAYAEPVNNFNGEETYAEPVSSFGGAVADDEPVTNYADYAEPVNDVTPVMDNAESEEEIRRQAREAAMAQARAEQEAAQAAARAAAEQEAAQAAARAAAEQEAARAAADAQAARAAADAQAARAAAAQQAAPQGTSSADEVIARIDQIDREGAPRETMREVATLLQKERAKPENKTPEQQKKLNEALSKLLKAMSAANRK